MLRLCHTRFILLQSGRAIVTGIIAWAIFSWRAAQGQLVDHVSRGPLAISKKFVGALLLPLTLGLALIVATVARFIAVSTEQSAVIQAQDAAHAISDRLRVEFDESMTATRTLRDTIAALREKQELSRPALTTLMRQTLEDNPKIYGIWSAWEPDALDGLDKVRPYAGR